MSEFIIKPIRLDVCFECGGKHDIHQHHAIPRSMGGTKTLPLCSDCYGKVHDRRFVNHSHMIRAALLARKHRGDAVGRRHGSIESIDKFLQKPATLKIIGYLEKGYSYRNISKITGHGTTLITKVNRLLKEYNNEI